MAFLKNMTSLFAVLCVIPAAFAVTARPGMLNTATMAAGVSATGNVRRMPTMTSLIASSTGNNVGTSSGSSSALLDDIECIDAYSECIKSEDSCGEDMAECTTNVLFHGKMPNCISTLAQCSASGINRLFGTSNISYLSNIAEKNEDDEVTRYTYPTDGSVLGQMILAAAIDNQYDTSTCVKRYMSCLNKDSVCGADFELCTDTREFKKQALFCESTLARCQADGVRELFGTYPWKVSTGTIGGRIATAIEDGAQLAAMNAVSTCYKVVEQCFLGACSANPLRCIEGSTLKTVQAANLLADDGATTTAQSDSLSKSDVNRYLKTSCLDTIGANKFCHMTFREKTPSKGELVDVDVQEEVFSAALDQRKKYIDSKIQDIMQKFDTKAKDKCVETIKSCAMRSCGEGVGSVCYTSVFNGTNESINKKETRADIKTGCEAVVNTDTNCQYAYASIQDQAYSYSYLSDGVFDTLFPEYDSLAAADPIGVIASLNATLSSSYSAAAIAQMKKQCQAVATSCVKSMCGTDYVNCYRNRTDIVGSLTQTDNEAFNTSMNKVGGVLDYTVVLGLCMNTVKTAEVCDEHLKIQKARLKRDSADLVGNNWGDSSSVRDGWVDAGGAKSVEFKEGVAKTNANGQQLCYNSKGMEGVCYEVDSDGDVYDEVAYESYDTYLTTQSATTLFRELLTDIEYEAQAKYNAKLTKQQNLCLSSNNGGIMGNNENGSTFMWVKLKSGKVPSTYAGAGLKSNQFVASNDLYGSFCRVRVTLGSDDINIQDKLAKGADWSTTYFAAGDAFTCGSWIPKERLQEIAEIAGADARETKEASQPEIRGWMAALGAIGLGTGGTFLGADIGNGDALSGLMGKKNKNKNADDFDSNKKKCISFVDQAVSALNSPETWTSAYTYANRAADYAQEIDVFTPGWPAHISSVATVCKAGNNSCPCGGDGKAAQVCVGDKTLSVASAEVQSHLQKLRSECSKQKEDDKEEDKKERGTKIGAGVGAAVGAIGGAALGYHITDSILDAQLDKAEQEAIQEFMDNVGTKIRCFIGGEEVGNYGQVISTSME